MKRKSILIIIFYTFLFFSCNVSEPESDTNYGNILPLVVGNNWNYQSLQYRYNEVDSSIIIIDSSFIKMRVTKTDTLDSFDGYFIDNFFIYLGWNISHTVFQNMQDGLYVARKFGYIVPPPPAKIGKLLSYPTFVGDILLFGPDLIIKTISLNEIVFISDNSLECIVYEVFSNDKLYGKFWMSPNIGIVKSWQLFGSVNMEHQLLNYGLN